MPMVALEIEVSLMLAQSSCLHRQSVKSFTPLFHYWTANNSPPDATASFASNAHGCSPGALVHVLPLQCNLPLLIWAHCGEARGTWHAHHVNPNTRSTQQQTLLHQQIGKDNVRQSGAHVGHDPLMHPAAPFCHRCSSPCMRRICQARTIRRSTATASLHGCAKNWKEATEGGLT